MLLLLLLLLLLLRLCSRFLPAMKRRLDVVKGQNFMETPIAFAAQSLKAASFANRDLGLVRAEAPDALKSGCSSVKPVSLLLTKHFRFSSQIFCFQILNSAL